MKKDSLKKLLPGYVLAFVTSFMFFIYEPLIMYSTNINEFWFDLYKILRINVLLFLSSFMIIGFIYTFIYFIDKICLKNNIILNFSTIIVYGIFLVLYIQGNYLINDLPPLDGSYIIWNKYSTQSIISIILIIFVFVSLLVLVKKFKFEKVINVLKYLVLGIFGMLFVSLITTLVTTEDVFERKKETYVTTENFGVYSENENFIIFLVDTVDSKKFTEVLNNNPEYNNLFEDFTYFPDTLAAYPYTRDSIPFIFSGIWNENKTSFKEYSNKAFNESKLLNTLKNENFDLNLYEKNLIWTDDKVKDISNVRFLENKIIKKELFFQETKYILFKYLPFPFKRYSKIETMDFDLCRNNNQEKTFWCNNGSVYKLIKNEEIEKVETKQFKFVHVMGGHTPFEYDKYVNKITNGTYEQNLEATLTIIHTYINKLKDNNLYDNSNIIIMSDHGYMEGSTIGRQNPILYIKGINEKHEMYESDLPISYADLSDAYLDLINGKSSKEIFQNISKDRKRRFLFYRYTKEDYKIEYEQIGKAWDEETLVKTGKEFNR